MVSKNELMLEIENISNMVQQLRDDMFYKYGFKKFFPKDFDRFNDISWHLCLYKNLINGLKTD